MGLSGRPRSLDLVEEAGDIGGPNAQPLKATLSGDSINKVCGRHDITNYFTTFTNL
jgi:hypothetical protein